MSDSTSLKVLKCPSCGAPLEPEKGGAPTMKCPYCGATAYIPESMRSSSGGSASSQPGGYTSLSDVTTLAKQGRLDEAAKIYSKITGLSYENAMFSVKSIAGIRDEEPSRSPAMPSSPSYNPPRPVETFSPPPYAQPAPSTPRVRVRSGGCLSGIIRFTIAVVILFSAFPVLFKNLNFQLPFELPFNSGESIIPPPFSKEVMSFKPSAFKDPRAIGLDENGNILLFNYNSSEVQVFDPEGNNILEFKVTENNGRELNQDNMVVSRDGTIFIPGFDSILVFNENAERVREIDNNEIFIIHSISIGPDDTLYAITSDGIVRLDKNGSVDLMITNATIEEVSGESPGIGAMGVDTQGNIYFIGSFIKEILKFSPNGEFVDKFGGDFDSVKQIAFDGYGRIYVVDFFDVKVYDADYGYINRIEGAFWGIDFDSQNHMYAVTTNSDKVVKYEIQKPGNH